MALGNLAELEENNPSENRPSPFGIFTKAVSSSQHYYSNHHVYPYTYMGGYCYRKKLYKEALKNWASASSVIKL